MRFVSILSALMMTLGSSAYGEEQESPEEKRCKAHVTAKKENAFQTTCGENQGIASNLRQVHEAGLEACEHSVRVVELLKEKTAEITRDGTNDAKEMQAELKKIDSLSATDAMKKAKEANNTVLEKFQMKNAVIKHHLEQYSKIYNRLQKIEDAYDKASHPLAHSNSHDGGACESEKQWWRGQVNSLDSEVTSVRKEAAANIQALNALYQKNMTTIGASQKQATQLTKSIAGMESLVKEDGSVDAKKSWLEKITGTDSPHEKEWVKTDCPPGSDQSACYDRAYKARSSSISDEAIGDISSPMQRKMTEPLPSGSSREAAVAAGGATPNEGASPKKYAGVLSDMTDVANGGSGYMSVDDMKKEGYSKAEIDRVLSDREQLYGKDGAKKIEEMTQARASKKANVMADHDGLMSRDEMKRLGYTDEKIQGIMADREQMYGKETAARLDAEATAREHAKINGHDLSQPDRTPTSKSGANSPSASATPVDKYRLAPGEGVPKAPDFSKDHPNPVIRAVWEETPKIEARRKADMDALVDRMEAQYKSEGRALTQDDVTKIRTNPGWASSYLASKGSAYDSEQLGFGVQKTPDGIKVLDVYGTLRPITPGEQHFLDTSDHSMAAQESPLAKQLGTTNFDSIPPEKIYKALDPATHKAMEKHCGGRVSSNGICHSPPPGLIGVSRQKLAIDKLGRPVWRACFSELESCD